jgi:hypothetical protein
MAPVLEILRELRYRPRVAPELLRDLLKVKLPQFDGVRVEALDGGRATDEAPLVVVLSFDRTPVHAIVVDAPDSCDSPARLLWPRWSAVVGERLSLPTAVMIVTVDEVVERWAGQPVHLPDGRSFHPFVVGPSSIPSDGQNTPNLVLMQLAARITGRA